MRMAEILDTMVDTLFSRAGAYPLPREAEEDHDTDDHTAEREPFTTPVHHRFLES